MKKLLTILIICVTMLTLYACAPVENSETSNLSVPGKTALVELGNCLYYDSYTGIVYWWNGAMSPGNYAATTPSPYYAPNGLPYKYNTETKTLEEIRRVDT